MRVAGVLLPPMQFGMNDPVTCHLFGRTKNRWWTETFRKVCPSRMDLIGCGRNDTQQNPLRRRALPTCYDRLLRLPVHVDINFIAQDGSEGFNLFS